MTGAARTWALLAAGLASVGLALAAAGAPAGPGGSAAAPGAAPDPALTQAVAKMTDIHDIRPPVPYGSAFPTWLLATGAAALLAAACFFLWRRRRRAQAVEELPPPPPDAVARAALAALGRDGGAPDKVFYTGLSAALRAYLEGRFGLDALERTTEELLPVLGRLPVSPELRRALAELFRFADPVKYADAVAGTAQRGVHLATATAFVEGTREVPAPVAPGEGA